MRIDVISIYYDSKLQDDKSPFKALRWNNKYNIEVLRWNNKPLFVTSEAYKLLEMDGSLLVWESFYKWKKKHELTRVFRKKVNRILFLLFDCEDKFFLDTYEDYIISRVYR